MTNTASLRSLMIALYKNDKSGDHQYMVSIRSGNITYRRTDQQKARLKSAKVRREQRKRAYTQVMQSVNMVPLTRSSTSLDWKNPSCLRKLMLSLATVCGIGERLLHMMKKLAIPAHASYNCLYSQLVSLLHIIYISFIACYISYLST